ncbi:class I SAM-dependent methyltransferase [Marinobacter arenosus]|uniref:class I SAM-dependent methyltransferase n=1 Tax=Marinobacter arenosus TaxID=2856822 RepID=UPI001C4D4DCB|nr:methyltransferase [Marinobacter arenosus]MBW0146710.1 methyltransferase [Marinobacter arenosus]
MTTAVLDYPDGQLSLSRPGGGDPSLRAWDAADELLLQEVFQRVDAGKAPKVLVVDDQFGALALGLHRYQPDLVADSATLAEALAHNARINPGAADGVSVRSWLNPPEGVYDVVIVRIPRHADYLAWLLRWANGILKPDGVLLAGGMIKHLPDRGVEVFAQAVHTEQVCPARKKARVVVCRRGEATLEGWSGVWKGYHPDDAGFRVEALPAVFAREKLDIGTRLLLPHVKRLVSGLATNAPVLDLACGNGVVGLTALVVRQDLSLTFSDVSSQAVVSARHNVSGAFPDSRVHFEHGDGIAESAGLFDLILLNPPFHEGGVVGDHVALRLFGQAAKHLTPGGRLLMVGNRHLGYHRSLRRFFPQVRQLDANPKFVVLEAGLG